MVTVSVVIPCYNQGQFLDETIDSVLAQSLSDLEIIVVNDGSTDPYTNALLAGYKRDRTRVITTVNNGLAGARNNGIAHARGRYILPLDADDKLAPEYLEKAAAVLDNEAEIGIVYCKALLFGAVEGEWLLPEYCIQEMLRDNVIFCSALFRRSDWEMVGGYDTGMVYGWEDYEFWLALIENGRQVKRLDEHFFYYRVASDSMVRSKEKWQKIAMFKRIYQRHSKLIGTHIETWIDALIDSRELYRTATLRLEGESERERQNSITLKVDTGTTRLRFDVGHFPGRKRVYFHPADCPVCLIFKGIECSGPDFSRRYETDSLQSNGLICHDGVEMFEDHEPMVTIDIPAAVVARAERISIELEYQAFGEQALQQMIWSLSSEPNKSVFHKIKELLRF